MNYKHHFTTIIVLISSICFSQKEIENRGHQVSSFQKAVDRLVLEKGISEKELHSLLKYNTRYEIEKRTGRAFAYAFGSLAGLGWFIEVSSRIPLRDGELRFFSEGDGLFVFGVAAATGAAISIPLFKASKRNKKRRDELSVKYKVEQHAIRNLYSKRRFRLYSVSYVIGITDTYYPIETSIVLVQKNLGISFTLDKNIISLYLSQSDGSSDVQDSEYTFSSFDLTYGRVFELGGKFSLEAHTGISKVTHNYRFGYPDPEENKGGGFGFNLSIFSSSVSRPKPRLKYENPIKKSYGIPLRAKLLFKINKLMGIGLNSNANFNKNGDVLSAGLSIQKYF